MNNKMKTLTIVSLLLNVLLIGFVLGDISQRFRKELISDREGAELTAELPKEKAALYSDTVKRVRQENRNVFEQMREAREEAMRILSAPEFDEGAYRVQVDRLHTLRGLMKQHLADATIELARKFNQQERCALAQHLRHSPGHQREHGARRNARMSGREEP
jgi:uncharacterized membrane protein